MFSQTSKHPKDFVFQEYLDNELPTLERKNFEDHLSACYECRELLSVEKSIYSLIGSLQEVELSTDLSPVILNKIKTTKQTKPLFERTIRIQMALTVCLVSIIYSSLSLDIVNITIQETMGIIISGAQSLIFSLSQSISKLYQILSNFQPSHFFTNVVSRTRSYSLNHILLLTISSSLLWLAGNKVLIWDKTINDRLNGG